MKGKVAILVVILSLAGEASLIRAKAMNPPYLSQFPSAEGIRAGVHGVDAMETAAKQASIFWQLHELIYSLAYSQGRTDRQFTADEQRLEVEYRNARYRAVEPFGEPNHQKPKWLEVYTRYENDRFLRDEVFKKYFSPDLRTSVYVALKEEMPTSTREGSTLTPTTSSASSTAPPIERPTALARGSWPAGGQTSGVTPLYVLTWLLLYFSPTIAAWVKKKKDADPSHGARLFFFVALVNTFFGWSCFGWVVAWAMVLSKRFGNMFVGPRRSSAEPATGGYAAPAPSTADAWDPTRMPERKPCSGCNGTGKQTCPSCLGRGSWYEQPQTASGIAQLVNCTYCIGSGRITCTSCAGSGRSSF